MYSLLAPGRDVVHVPLVVVVVVVVIVVVVVVVVDVVVHGDGDRVRQGVSRHHEEGGQAQGMGDLWAASKKSKMPTAVLSIAFELPFRR